MNRTADTGSLEELYRLHRRTLMWYLRTRVHVDPHTAEDILQETFLRAWRTPEVLSAPPEACRAWLVTVARNLLIDSLRRRSRRPQETSDAMLTDIPMGWCVADRSVTRMALHQAMSQLTPYQREIIGQIFIMERTHPETAAELGIPLGTVKSRAHSALVALRRHLAAAESPVADEELLVAA
ncbi:sigma-70 family RNA polymerase sigma factor [Lentzea sp. NBRC 105346]|uniref:sigma-70 family RNA polymerase sigma factor n=1 Tax=Lentzea sp. NBRC 105346 TaxID=3032205 RepID=UPI0025528C7A|nr:sigma-70 family RNA polymerase sigma factor [Lentzea sp. NBRC 105346]